MQLRRSTVSFALSSAALTSALATPTVVRVMERWGIRAIALRRLALFAASLAMLSLSPHSPTRSFDFSNAAELKSPY
jgi:MFS family permease